jgi:pyrroline-5-carboxylate reductase
MPKTIGFIGYGSMGKMILAKYLQQDTAIQKDIYLSNRTFSKIEKLNISYRELHLCLNNQETAKNSDLLFVCVKPFDIKPVLLEIADSLKSSVHIISFNDSILLEHLETVCGGKKLSKIVPSVTAEVGRSIILACHNQLVNDEDKKSLYSVLKTCGTIMEIPEKEINIASEMTGCMPGFISALIECFVAEAMKHTAWLTSDQISTMVCETIRGTTTILLEQKTGFRKLIERVATKGGITEEGIKVIDAKFPAVVKDILSNTLAKRRITTEKLAKEFL